MKKNLITLITAAAMLISTAALAADAPENLLNQPAAAEDNFAPVMAMPSYISNTVTVTAIDGEKIETVLAGQDKENFDNIINYTIFADTLVIGMANGEEKSLEDVKAGDTITVFTNGYAPAPLMLPPQYQANVIMVYDNMEISSNRFCDVDTYIKNEEGALVNIANTLELNLGEETKITGLTGRMTTIDELENKDLAVIYTTSTRSIPAQTTPIAIYVLGENEQALAAIEAAKTTPQATLAPQMTAAPEATAAPIPEVTETSAPAFDFAKVTAVKAGNETIDNFYVKDGILMLPLRKITEAAGFTVEWDDAQKAVTLNSGMYSLKIGENSYIKGRMVPQTLKAAPEIKNDRTFVPVDYFLDILELTYSANGSALEF